MNYTKLLNELKMKNGRSVKFNKKYLFAAIVMFCVQAILGTNLAIAVPCEAEMKRYCSLTNSRDANWCSHPSRTHVEVNAYINSGLSGAQYEGLQSREKAISWYINDRKTAYDQSPGGYAETDMKVCFEKAIICMYKNGARKQDSNTFTDYKGCDGGPQSSSSGSSSQSSSSSASSQSNSSSSNNQSSSSDNERIKKLNEAIDQFNNADKQKDYAKAIPALNIVLANSNDKETKAKAARVLGDYYKFGLGVQKDEVKAQALFEQASIAGDPNADTNICENYENGTGGVTKNHQTAIKYCTAAATKGHVIAMAKLGYLYHAGEGTYNPQLGNEWICKAAKQGDSGAIGNAKILNLNCN